MIGGRPADKGGMEVEQIEYEIIRMLGIKFVGAELLLREVSKVESDNQVRVAMEGGGNDMAVVRIGQIDGGDQVFEPFDQRIPDVAVHQHASPLQQIRRYVRPVFEHIPDPLVVDQITPFGPVEIGEGQMHEKIA